MTPLTSFLPLVRSYAPAVPNPVAEQQLRLAAKEFLTRTRLWREPVTVAVTANPFVLAPANTVVVAVERAVFNDTKLVSKVLSDIALDRLGDTGAPENLVQMTPESFYLYPFEAGTVTATVFLAPQAGPRFGVAGPTTAQAVQGQVPDFVFDEHAEAIAFGALKRIHEMPNQPYTDANAAMSHGGKFETAIASAKPSYLKGKQRAPLRTKPQFM